MKIIPLISALLIITLLFQTKCPAQEEPNEYPVKVEVKQIGSVYRLFRVGSPFYIKGAGGGLDKIAALVEHGGNSIRTWSTHNAQAILDSAQAHGLTVLMGLHVDRERHGFNYNDKKAVRNQLVRIRGEIEKYKNHPALLGWGIGNELNLNYSIKKVWNAVEEIARMIHEIDGNHPTTTMLAGINKDEVDYIKENCPSLDFLSVQMYADVINIRERIAAAGWNGPYAITEWGATGHWEVAKTEWGAAVEQTSTERAAVVKERFEKAIALDTTQCLGSYVFLWGQKQERTPTWYGLFLESGEEMESIDVMHYLWTGGWPENRVPQINEVALEGKTRYQNIRLNPNEKVTLTFHTSDFENDALQTNAEVLPESTDLGEGGDYESRPKTVNGLVLSQTLGEVVFVTPEEPGAYRIFVYIRDGHNNAATANVPFYVE
jgi:hypothetical protein